MSEPVAVRVPQINPNDEHAVVVRWHVEKGARVRAGQPLVTLETTKTTFDVDAPSDGYAFFEHEPNAELAVGAPVAWIADNDGPLQIAAP
ncbi:MAG: biotin/lipoyl-binding protein, partial [Lysobacterales bacterium]